MPDRKNDADPTTLAAGRRPDPLARGPHPISGGADGEPFIVQIDRTPVPPTEDQSLWTAIRHATEQLGWDSYKSFVDVIMCGEDPPAVEPGQEEAQRDRLTRARTEKRTLRYSRALPFPDVEPYRLLKAATEVFMMVHCGALVNQQDQVPKLPTDTFPFLSETDVTRDERPRYYRAVTKDQILKAWHAYHKEVNRDTTDTRVFTLPYYHAILERKLGDVSIVPRPQDNEWLAICMGIMREKLTHPCLLELIWSYWHEEGMLVQTLNAISQRFQNVRGGRNNPLAQLEISPLRPLGNLLWGYIQDEQHRLSVRRRAYEYDHHYGITLHGKAVPELSPADSRSRFIEAFHNLLREAADFYKRDDDKTIVADPFPVLNALREVHLVLSEGAHNQYGDLPWTARIEMLIQQWILARPEFREFLPTRIMVAYPEDWMDRVDAMKKLQGWTDVSVLHFRNLAVFGEQILLSARFGNWNGVIQPIQAANWARYWRAEVQGYLHAYRGVTGVDITDTAEASRGLRYLMPSIHLRNRLAGQAPALAPGQPAALPPARPAVAPPAPARALPQPAREW